MEKISATCLSIALVASLVTAQTPPPQPRPQQPQTGADEILRITTELVQTDVVVTDKNDQLITDLKLGDFEVYENGKRQEVSFMEFVSVDSLRRSDDASLTAKVAPGVDTTVARDLSAKDLKRVIAFVVDDVTIPSEDMSRVRQMLLDYVDNKMQEGDLVAIVRTVGGKGLLEQFTADRQILRRAVAQLGVRSIPPYLAFGGPEGERVTSVPQPLGDGATVFGADGTGDQTIGSGTEFEGPSEGTNQVPRAVLALSVSNALVDSLRQVPGRKNLVLLSGGLPLFDLTRGGTVVSDVGQRCQLLVAKIRNHAIATNA